MADTEPAAETWGPSQWDGGKSKSLRRDSRGEGKPREEENQVLLSHPGGSGPSSESAVPSAAESSGSSVLTLSGGRHLTAGWPR